MRLTCAAISETGDSQREMRERGPTPKGPLKPGAQRWKQKDLPSWVYRYVEDGRRKTEYIGDDNALRKWKARHPV